MQKSNVEEWKWEPVWGTLVPIISASERMEWARLGRETFLSFTEASLRKALQDKVQYRAKKIAAARRKYPAHLSSI